MTDHDGTDIKAHVREAYARVAQAAGGGCGCSCGSGGCCGAQEGVEASLAYGYSAEDLAAVPEGADLGLGCGNPLGLALAKPGDTVVDLGSGAGFDAFLAARAVGPAGRVIGVDMTPEMIARARANAARGGRANVEFRLGEIEALPIEGGTADLVVSNCVISLSPDKPKVFAEAFRVLKPGGRLAVSDIVLTKPLPPAIRNSIQAYTACIAGASLKTDYLEAVRAAGFGGLVERRETSFEIDFLLEAESVREALDAGRLTPEDLAEAAAAVKSLTLEAVKPS